MAPEAKSEDHRAVDGSAGTEETIDPSPSPSGIGELIDAAVDELTDAPPPGEVAAFQWRGATLIAEEASQGETTFVLVHGIGMGRGVFGDVGAELRRYGKVVLIDQPGYGEAPEPPETLSMEETGDLVHAFIVERGYENVVLIGHSMGTQVVTAAAARHPGSIARLVLVAPTVDKDARRLSVQIARLALDLGTESPKVLLLGAREYVRTGPNVRKKLRAMLDNRPEDAYGSIEVPALVIRGERDRVCPHDWCKWVADALPHGSLVELEGHAHETMIRNGAPAAGAITEWIGFAPSL